MFPFKQVVSVFLVVLVAILLAMVMDWQRAKVKAAREETKSVVRFRESETTREVGQKGETVATQPKNEVAKSTFKNLTRKRIGEVEKESGLDLGNVSSLTEAGLSTVRELKAPLVTEPPKVENRSPDSFPTKTFRIRTRFGSMSGRITGDSISIRDSITNPLMVLETRPKWKLRHLWPWNWGTRKREVKLLILNPDSRIDTLSNISIVP